MIGSLFGSPFPTVTFIGHPSFKELGGRTFYSLLNGILLVVLASFGGIKFLLTFLPEQAFYPMVMFIGIDIFSSTYEAIDKKHLAAVTIGIMPGFANYLNSVMSDTVKNTLASLNTTKTFYDVADDLGGSPVFFQGVIRLSQGFVLTGLTLSSCVYFLIEKQFLKASYMLLTQTLLTIIGITHSFKIEKTGVVTSSFIWDEGKVVAWEEAVSYALLAATFIFMHFIQRCRRGPRHEAPGFEGGSSLNQSLMGPNTRHSSGSTPIFSDRPSHTSQKTAGDHDLA